MIFTFYILQLVFIGIMTSLIVAVVMFEHRKTRKDVQEVKSRQAFSKQREYEILDTLGKKGVDQND